MSYRTLGTHYLGYCSACAKVVEVRRQSDVDTRCPECGAENPRGIDSLPDAKIAALVEEEQLTHEDLEGIA
jgi:PHP family Zn ribbon phosphoesterase